jgi:hypothetical protein
MTAFVLAAMLMLVGVERAAAHDTFVLPEKFRVAKGETVVIGFHSSVGFSFRSLRASGDCMLFTWSSRLSPRSNGKTSGPR